MVKRVFKIQRYHLLKNGRSIKDNNPACMSESYQVYKRLMVEAPCFCESHEHRNLFALIKLFFSPIKELVE